MVEQILSGRFFSSHRSAPLKSVFGPFSAPLTLRSHAMHCTRAAQSSYKMVLHNTTI